MRATGLPTVMTMTIHHEPETREGHSAGGGLPRAGRRRRRRRRPQLLARARRRCCRCSRRSAPRSTATSPRCPVPYRTTDEQRSMQSLRDPHGGEVRPFPTASTRSPARATSSGDFARDAHALGVGYLGVCCGAAPAPHPRGRRGARPDAAGEPLLARHVQARLLGHGRARQGALPAVRRASVTPGGCRAPRTARAAAAATAAPGALEPRAEPELRAGDVERGHDAAAEVAYRRGDGDEVDLGLLLGDRVAELARPLEPPPQLGRRCAARSARSARAR